MYFRKLVFRNFRIFAFQCFDGLHPKSLPYLAVLTYSDSDFRQRINGRNL